MPYPESFPHAFFFVIIESASYTSRDPLCIIFWPSVSILKYSSVEAPESCLDISKVISFYIFVQLLSHQWRNFYARGIPVAKASCK